MGPGLIKRKNDFAHTYEETCGNFVSGGPPGPRKPKSGAIFGKNSKKNSLRSKSSKVSSYVCANLIYISFKSSPVKKY